MDRVALPVLLKKGAEASLFIDYWHSRKVVVKKRSAKKYRPAELDLKIRTYRTIHEAQLLSEAKKAGVPTPTIFFVDIKSSTIIMEMIDGEQVKRLIGAELPEKVRGGLCAKIGELIGRLHHYGIVHGDLTTSNMILNPEGKVIFVDFGLGEKTREVEARGVDLHLMKRALKSTHHKFAKECFRAVMKGYADVVGKKEAEEVSNKIGEIEKRGRYNEKRRKDQ